MKLAGKRHRRASDPEIRLEASLCLGQNSASGRSKATVRRGSKVGGKTGGKAGVGGKGGKGGKGAKRTAKEKAYYKAGKRNADSDSDFSYRSVYSAGGTRHVRRRKKNPDGTYGDSESYHSSQDEDGEARRRKRRRDRDHPDSAHSYYSVVSEGGTRHVRRRVKNEDGTYGDSESYHSGDTGKDDESDSDYSYASERSEGGTRYEVKRKRIRDGYGKIIGHGEKEVVGEAASDADSVRTRRGSMDGGTLNKKGKEGLGTDLTGGDQTAQGGSNERGDEDDAEPASLIQDKEWPGEEMEKRMSSLDDFSDVTTDDDVDLSKMTEEEKKEYFRQKELKRQAREKRRREKYGDKYEDIMKRREQKRLELQKEKEEEERKKKEEEERLEREKLDKLGEGGRRSSMRRNSSRLGDKDKVKERPKSMVTYEKGPPREFGKKDVIDNREIGLTHDTWGKSDKDGKSRRGSDSSQGSDNRKLFRENTSLSKLPAIPQGRVLNIDNKRQNKGGRDGRNLDDDTITESSFVDDDLSTVVADENDKKDKENEKHLQKDSVIEVGADGKLRLKKKRIDLKDFDDDTLRKLGIDPNLSKQEITRRLKQIFGDDIKVVGDDGQVIGTKGIDEFDPNLTDEQLAEMEDLDLTTLKGQRRVNILFRRGGSALRRHLQNILGGCKLKDDYAHDLDERDSAIDFLSHYRLVDPLKLDGYAKAFVVEDSDFDAVLSAMATKTALDGVENVNKVSDKQIDYVMKVLHIDDATNVTFRMFAVFTALIERVTTMDELSKHLLEICNLADIERKLDLYKAMFYHNIPSYRDTNFITSESLKIELMAGGLNWKQQDFIMDKMEPNKMGEISFLDYMCYIPLFLSLHDNICINPLDMSDEKYQMPPRRRPPSAQRDMNPLGQPLKKESNFLTQKLARDIADGKYSDIEMTKEKKDTLRRFSRLPDITSMLSVPERQRTDMTESSKVSLIY